MTDEQKHVLIAEDDRPLAKAMQLGLEFAGIDTAIAYNGQDCLNALKTKKFDVVLLDLMMPILDGFQVLEALQGQTEDNPVIFVTSNLSQQHDKTRALSLGAARYFVKADTPLPEIIEAIKNA